MGITIATIARERYKRWKAQQLYKQEKKERDKKELTNEWSSITAEKKRQKKRG